MRSPWPIPAAAGALTGCLLWLAHDSRVLALPVANLSADRNARDALFIYSSFLVIAYCSAWLDTRYSHTEQGAPWLANKGRTGGRS